LVPNKPHSGELTGQFGLTILYAESGSCFGDAGVYLVKKIIQACIQACNDAVHFVSLEALEDAVRSCEEALEEFPSLKVSHPHEATTIEHYWRMKQLLRDCFCDP